MSKSKRRAEVAPNPEAEAADLPEAWKKRPWVPYLIMGILVAVVLGSGLALQQAVNQPADIALRGQIMDRKIFAGPIRLTDVGMFIPRCAVDIRWSTTTTRANRVAGASVWIRTGR